MIHLLVYLPKDKGPALYWTRCDAWVEDREAAKVFPSREAAGAEIQAANERGLAWDKEPGIFVILSL